MSRAVDWIIKKREGATLSTSEIKALFESYLSNQMEDYQMSALLMAIYFQGMATDELVAWTDEMLKSGDTFDFSHLPGPKVDKHSTGGVGDKISLPLAPLLASCNLYVPMISGRGLGHTGGTLDKLESIHGFNTQQSADQFESILSSEKVCMIGQTPRIVPADRRLYALRDVTGTVPSIQLIASSIMSKKLAEGTEFLILDVKVGQGAFMKTIDDARVLAQTCIALGHRMGRKVRALLTQMDTPLGRYVGNALEVRESVELLRGEGPKDTRMLTLALAEELLEMTGNDPKQAQYNLDSGAALDCFYRMIDAQGGDRKMVEDLSLLPRARHRTPIIAEQDGWLSQLSARNLGDACVYLGAGRRISTDQVDPRVGLEITHQVGDPVIKGEPLLWIEHEERGLEEATHLIKKAIHISDEKTTPSPLIYERIDHQSAQIYQPLC